VPSTQGFFCLMAPCTQFQNTNEAIKQISFYCILVLHIFEHYFVHHWPNRFVPIDTKVPTCSPMFLQNIVKSMPNQRTLASLRKTNPATKSLVRRKMTPGMKLYLAILILSLSWKQCSQLINTMLIAEIATKQKLKN